ncbi:YkuS family protein [Clostridium akagii]|uniref:YkuS family protein n=1 Tax=Clostridium akagii TaxID=91623 RepID=UPI00047D8D23|nr:YkuS family protein [Clostridium akagii]
MKICVSDELRYVSEELKKRGYTIVTINSNNDCDALICDLKNGGLNHIGCENSIKKDGMLIIDIGSKSIDEIEYILKNRLYTSIF